jgi:hypothetical protein
LQHNAAGRHFDEFWRQVGAGDRGLCRIPYS